jgi:hypothetical protein
MRQKWNFRASSRPSDLSHKNPLSRPENFPICSELQSLEGVASQQDGDASLMAQAKQDSQRSPSKSPTTMTVKKATKSLNYSGYGATAETPASIYGTTNELPYPI